MKHKILCNLDLKDCKKEISNLKKISEFQNFLNKKDIEKRIRDATIFICSASLKLDKKFFIKAKKLKLIFTPSTGTDHIDFDEVKKNKIKVYHIAKEKKLINNFTATSELAFCLLLNLLRKSLEANKEAKNGIWAREKFSGFQLKDKVIGIIGYGRLGKITAKIAKGFGMKILINDIKKIKKSSSFKKVKLDHLLKKSDYIFLHVHLTPKTNKLINKKNIKLMKKNTILINTSRGKLIDEKALLNSLKKKKIAGAGLDMIDGEWLDKKKLYNHKLIKFSRKHSNLLILPHIGGSTYESIVGARKFILNKAYRLIKR